jgi:hypothetical protein
MNEERTAAYTETEVLEYLGITLTRLKELEAEDRLPVELWKAAPHQREPGKLDEVSPENEKSYAAEDVEKLKRELSAEG